MSKITEMDKELFAKQFLASVWEMYEEWQFENDCAKMPDWEEAFKRTYDEGLVALGELDD